MCVLIGTFIAVPLVVRADFPVELGILLSSLLLGVTIRLGYLFYQGKKHNGTFSLRGIVLYWGHMPWWHYLLIFVPFLLYALVLEGVLQPVSKTLIAHVFWWLPVALLPSTAAVKLTTATLITGLLVLLIDELIAPCVEELYYRGYLLTCLERLGWLAPVLTRCCLHWGISGSRTITCSFSRWCCRRSAWYTGNATSRSPSSCTAQATLLPQSSLIRLIQAR